MVMEWKTIRNICKTTTTTRAPVGAAKWTVRQGNGFPWTGNWNGGHANQKHIELKCNRMLLPHLAPCLGSQVWNNFARIRWIERFAVNVIYRRRMCMHSLPAAATHDHHNRALHFPLGFENWFEEQWSQPARVDCSFRKQSQARDGPMLIAFGLGNRARERI